MAAAFPSNYFPALVPVPTRFRSLGDATRALLDTAEAHRPLSVTVASIPVRDAAALSELFRVHQREAVRKRVQASRVTNAAAIDHLVSAATLLCVLDTALLPALDADPWSKLLVDTLRECGEELKARAHGVGGTFEGEASAICNEIAAYVAFNPVERAGDVMMRAIVKKIGDRVSAALDTTCSFTDTA